VTYAGGALVVFEWVRGKWTAVKGNIGDFEVLFCSVDDVDVAIERLNCNVESEMLGIR